MRPFFFLPLLLIGAAHASPLRAQSAHVHVGTRFETFGIVGEEREFAIEPGRRLYAWIELDRVGAPTVVIVVWKRNGVEALRHTLQVRADHSAAVTRRHFQPGEDGSWTIQVLSASGAELGVTRFEVKVAAPPPPATAAPPPA